MIRYELENKLHKPSYRVSTTVCHELEFITYRVSITGVMN